MLLVNLTETLVTHRFSRGRLARTLIEPVNWLFCKYLPKDKLRKRGPTTIYEVLLSAKAILKLTLMSYLKVS
jgi:hypothetical protein